MKYLIVNKKVAVDSFLAVNLNIFEYCELRFGRDNLITILRNNLPALFEDAQIIFTSHSFDNIDLILREKNINYADFDSENDHLIYFDMSVFPLDFTKLNNVFAKALINKKPTRFYIKNGDRKTFLPLAIDKNSSELEIDLSEMVVDLKEADSLLQLFFSNFNSRYFNDLSRSRKNYIVKSSSDIQKIKSEFNFLSHIPLDVKTFYPHLGSYCEAAGNAEYEIEKIYMLDLSKQIINKILRESDLEKLLTKLENYLTISDSKKVDRVEFEKNFNQSFIEKNSKRFAALKNLEIFETLNQLAKIQGYSSCEDFYNQLQQEIKNILSRKSWNYSLIFSHGDLCFSNILYDIHTSGLKLIDPKGFNNSIAVTYRSIYYDLAKLSHSFMGFYDLILYNMVEIKFSENGNRLILDFDLDEKYKKLLRDKFANFIQKMGFDLNVVRLLEASLFFSMIPLHQEDKKRMIAQFVQATNIFESVKNQ